MVQRCLTLTGNALLLAAALMGLWIGRTSASRRKTRCTNVAAETPCSRYKESDIDIEDIEEDRREGYSAMSLPDRNTRHDRET